MANCYLCEHVAEISGHDYGRRKIVHCRNCGHYEVTNIALSKIQEPEFPLDIKKQLIDMLQTTKNAGGYAEIVLGNSALEVRQKDI